MILCKIHHIDRDRCECETEDKKPTLEQMIQERIELEKKLYRLDKQIQQERNRLGQKY